MELQLKPMFTCISITRKPKLYVAMFHTSLDLLLEAKARPVVFVEKNKYA